MAQENIPNDGNPPVGSQVFVRWYGKVVKAQVTTRTQETQTALWINFVPVLLEIPDSYGRPIAQGRKNICLFHFKHLYNTQQEAEQAGKNKQQEMKERHDTTTTSTLSNPSKEWQLLQEFKREHWDYEHNHLDVKYLDDYYEMFRKGVERELQRRRGSEYEQQPTKQPMVQKANTEVSTRPKTKEYKQLMLQFL